MASALQLAGDSEGRRTLLLPHADGFVAVPFSPKESVEIVAAEAFYGVRQLTLKRQAAHLAVCNDLQIRFFLEGYRRIYRSVFDLLEFRKSEPPFRELRSSPEKPWRSEQTPHDIRMRRNHAAIIFTTPDVHHGDTEGTEISQRHRGSPYY